MHATTKKGIARIIYLVSAMANAKQRAAKYIPAETDTRNNRSIARLRRGKQALSTIQAVFSVGSCKIDTRESRLEAGNIELRQESCERTRGELTDGVSLRKKKRLDVCCSYSETVINPLPGYDY
jgi:hypothetical protein